MVKIKIKNIQISKLLRYFLLINGGIFVIGIILAFTTLPYWGYHWLGTSKTTRMNRPEAIVLLGGSGMPSQSNLMRSWYASRAARNFPESKVWIVMPGDLTDSTSTPRKMKNELILRGVQAHKISFEEKGTNTRSQALNCRNLLKPEIRILVITSPEHMRRAILSFQKAGFQHVNGYPAFEEAAEADFSFTDDDLGGNKTLIPDVGKNTSVRYQVWNHLNYEILIAREFLALGYYKIRGWI
jgi:uncharacterized SAM-binding protein YcdF (DUF218 family)